MTLNTLIRLILLYGIVFPSYALAALKTLETPHFLFHYQEHLKKQAEIAATAAESVYPGVTDRLGWQPEAKIQVHLVDNQDYANGWAKPFPRLQMSLIASPPDSVNSLENYGEWYALLIEHELTHIVHLDMAENEVVAGRNLFGSLVWLFPNLFQPTWLIEGLAVQEETHLLQDKRTLGRGESSLYQMMMREEVRNGILSVEQLNADFYHWPQNKQYLYGFYFYLFLQETYGEEKQRRLLHNYAGNLIPFLLNSTAKQTFGKDFLALWNDFERWLRQRFSSSLQTSEPSIALGLPAQNLSSLVSDGKAAYFLANDGYHATQLVRIQSDGSVSHLTDLTGQGNLSVHPEYGYLYARPTQYFNGEVFYDLYRLKPQSGRWQEEAISHKGRYRHACYSPDGQSILAYRIQDGIGQIDQLDRQGNRLASLWQGQAGEVISTLQCDPHEQTLLISKKQNHMPWQLYVARYNDVSTPLEWQALPTFDAHAFQPSWSSDGQSVYFVSDVSGRYQIYRRSMDVDRQEIVQIASTASGHFSPVPVGEELYLQGYTQDGYVLSRLRGQGSQAWNAQIATRYPDYLPKTTVNGEERDYSPLPSLKPAWWFPLFSFSEEDSRLGFSTSGEDGAQQHFYALSASYEIQHNNPNLLLSYQYQRDMILSVMQDHRYVNTNTLSYIEGSRQAAIDFPHWLSWNRDHWFIGSGAIWSEERVDEKIAGSGSVVEEETSLVGARLNYLNTASYRYSLSPALLDSLRWQWEYHTDQDYDGSRMQWQWQWRRPLGEFAGTSLYDHSVLGVEANYYRAEKSAMPWELGGSFVDNDSYGQQQLALPGYPDQIQIGTEGYQLRLNWLAPLDRDAQTYSMWPVGYSALDMELFASAGSLGGDDLSSLGAALHSTFNLGYRLPLVLEAGIAQGMQSGGEQQFYLLLRSDY